MIAAAHVVVQHDSPVWGVFMALAVTGGIAGIALVCGFCWWLISRESSNRPIIPWSPRMRVEKVKATREIAEEHLRMDALEVKRLALSHQRDRVVAAIQAGEDEEVQRLGLPAPENGQIEDAEWWKTHSQR